MVFSRVLVLAAAAAMLTQAQASYLNNDLSFGHLEKISPNLRGIPNFHLMGKPEPPEIYSNKIVLTPPGQGNQRGAIWAEKPLLHSVWTADIDFRATGPERGGGNLQIWYVKDGKDTIGTSSVYTAGRFDGLVLIVDQYVNSAGYIRGFLNDGSTDYASHHSVDSIAFGHCEYPYRNLGRPSRITVSQTADKFSVTVDGKLCFDSNKIKLPIGNSFGLTAASRETPDSVEVFKFVVTTESHTADVPDVNGLPQFSGQQAPMGNSKREGQGQVPLPNNMANVADGDLPAFNDPPEAPAEQYKSQETQFADLHNRLQAMMKHISALNRDVNRFSSVATDTKTTLQFEIGALQKTILGSLARLDKLDAMERKLNEIELLTRQSKVDMQRGLDRHASGIKEEVRDSHGTVMGHIGDNRLGIWSILFVVLGSEVVLMFAYVAYKRRKANGPKKYL